MAARPRVIAGMMVFGLTQLVSIPTAEAGGTTTFTVDSTADPGTDGRNDTECTLREAITAANANGTTHDIIAFDITGDAPYTISPTSALPTITAPVTIDGTTEPDYTASPVVAINGSSAGEAHGLSLTTGDSVISGLSIGGFHSLINNEAAGIFVNGGTGNNLFTKNYLGVAPDGTTAVPNRAGIMIHSSPSNEIGSGLAGEGNLISANTNHQVITMFEGSDDNVVQGNIIGLDASGTQPFKGGIGVLISQGNDVVIGGTSPTQRNVITGKSDPGFGAGIFLQFTEGTTIKGNYIGTDISGNGNPLASEVPPYSGIQVYSSTSDLTIGGTTPAAANVISGNANGIIVGQYSNDLENIDILGNLIGVGKDGTTPIPNGTVNKQGYGIGVYYQGATIGGNTVSGRNVIANSGLDGIAVIFDAPTTIKANSIFDNGDLGIDLEENGVTPNDPGDTDEGANNLQNFPALRYAGPGRNGGFLVRGQLNSVPSSNYVIRFFTSKQPDPSGFGEGEKFIGGTTVTTNAQGKAPISELLGVPVATGHYVTATATAADGSTSEFSKAKRFCTQLGSASADQMEGTPSPDVLCGRGGPDKLEGFGKNDVLLGGTGDDKLFGGDGKDWLFGQKGNDKLDGGPGEDTCHQGPGSGNETSC